MNNQSLAAFKNLSTAERMCVAHFVTLKNIRKAMKEFSLNMWTVRQCVEFAKSNPTNNAPVSHREACLAKNVEWHKAGDDYAKPQLDANAKIPMNTLTSMQGYEKRVRRLKSAENEVESVFSLRKRALHILYTAYDGKLNPAALRACNVSVYAQREFRVTFSRGTRMSMDAVWVALHELRYNTDYVREAFFAKSTTHLRADRMMSSVVNFIKYAFDGKSVPLHVLHMMIMAATRFLFCEVVPRDTLVDKYAAETMAPVAATVLSRQFEWTWPVRHKKFDWILNAALMAGEARVPRVRFLMDCTKRADAYGLCEPMFDADSYCAELVLEQLSDLEVLACMHARHFYNSTRAGGGHGDFGHLLCYDFNVMWKRSVAKMRMNLCRSEEVKIDVRRVRNLLIQGVWRSTAYGGAFRFRSESRCMDATRGGLAKHLGTRHLRVDNFAPNTEENMAKRLPVDSDSSGSDHVTQVIVDALVAEGMRRDYLDLSDDVRNELESQQKASAVLVPYAKFALLWKNLIEACNAEHDTAAALRGARERDERMLDGVDLYRETRGDGTLGYDREELNELNVFRFHAEQPCLASPHFALLDAQRHASSVVYARTNFAKHLGVSAEQAAAIRDAHKAVLFGDARWLSEHEMCTTCGYFTEHEGVLIGAERRLHDGRKSLRERHLCLRCWAAYEVNARVPCVDELLEFIKVPQQEKHYATHAAYAENTRYAFGGHAHASLLLSALNLNYVETGCVDFADLSTLRTPVELYMRLCREVAMRCASPRRVLLMQQRLEKRLSPFCDVAPHVDVSGDTPTLALHECRYLQDMRQPYVNHYVHCDSEMEDMTGHASRALYFDGERVDVCVSKKHDLQALRALHPYCAPQAMVVGMGNYECSIACAYHALYGK